MYSFSYIMFIIVMGMSCDIISGIICMFYFLCKIVVIIEISKLIYFSYSVRIISVNGITFIDNNIISIILICVCCIMCFIYTIVSKNIS